MKKFVFLLLSVMAGTILLAILSGCSSLPRTLSLDEQAQDIDRSLMCPLCAGQTIAESQSELSAQMRAVVREKLEQGATKEEILQFFVDRYGEGVLAAPAKSGFNLVVWLAPTTSIIVGSIILWLVIRKWARGGKKYTSGPVVTTQGVNDDEKYRKQLEEELNDFDERGFR